MTMSSWQWVHFYSSADGSLWHGDSLAWMRVALREDAESGRVTGKTGINIDHARLNVSLVSAGIAIELIYKVLLVADKVEIKSVHTITTLHGLLQSRKALVEGILLDEGWPSVEAFLEFMDESIRHGDRKYWMSNPAKGVRHATGFVIGIELMTTPGLARVHKRMAALVDAYGLVTQYNLENGRVMVTQAITSNHTMGYKAMATRRFDCNGQKVEYTVYEALGQGRLIPDYMRGWWEMPQESGGPTGRFVFLLDPGEFDDAVDYWPGQTH